MDVAADRTGLILFGDDGLPASDVAWAWLISHTWTGWNLESLTVRETLFPGGPPTGDAQFVPRQAAPDVGFTTSVHSLIDGGDPRVVLLERNDASLLVVGSRHRSHLAGLWAGSTAEWLLVSPPVPLVIARRGHRTRSVAVCIDGGAHALQSLRTLAAMPWAHGTEVHLVTVDDGATDVDAALGQARTMLPPSQQAKEVRLSGPPRRALTEFVSDARFDLVVLGTRGLKGVSRLTAGSTVSALTKQTDANLLLAHSRTAFVAD